ncbi:hypothetical protein [Streptomyces sp. YIM 98790]|uniref:hypothetical protein n=1 Tax=Streptomyces sp. YIM 98790 TaxID=2689077 RepID=UPI00140E0365|nr:hypothetical protein [Streptomyces sp. YIM 98790]
MSSYEGRATIRLDSGRELAVAARLHKTIISGRTIWGGTLSVPANSQPIELTNLPQGILIIGDCEGAFIRPDVSDWLSSPAGRFEITIEGNGDAPF